VTINPDSAGDLLEHVRQGDQASFAELHGMAFPSVIRVVQSILRDPSQSEEVAQEVFLEVWLHADRFRASRGHGLSWILTIARRRAIDRVRASQASRERDLRIGVRDFPDPYDAVAEAVDLRSDIGWLHQALNSLPAHDRDVIDLVHLRGRGHRDVAQQLGIAPGTVKSRLHYALHALRAVAAQP
jgi:RNA polymerase sigma-70 factor (ECF subfamily)